MKDKAVMLVICYITWTQSSCICPVFPLIEPEIHPSFSVVPISVIFSPQRMFNLPARTRMLSFFVKA